MLLDQLIRLQRERRMTDKEFAAVLGVTRQLWQLTRTRRVAIGIKVLSGVERAFPELWPEMRSFLRQNASGLDNDASLLVSKHTA